MSIADKQLLMWSINIIYVVLQADFWAILAWLTPQLFWSEWAMGDDVDSDVWPTCGIISILAWHTFQLYHNSSLPLKFCRSIVCKLPQFCTRCLSSICLSDPPKKKPYSSSRFLNTENFGVMKPECHGNIVISIQQITHP